MHMLFKVIQITIYEDKGSQDKSRMQTLLEKYLDGERVLSHTPQSDFTLAHPKPVSGCRAQFCKPAQLTQVLPPGILFTIVLESHTTLTCQARQ